MKVHLVAPSKKRNSSSSSKELHPPLGLMTLAAYTPEDVQLRLIDENVEPIDFSEVPELVGITTMTATASRAYQIADRYRELGAKVVMGGIHASMMPQEASEHADSVVIGEAELIWPRVVSDADTGRLEQVYQSESFIDYQRPRFPRRDLINTNRYWSVNGIQTSRGCPHNCNFCSVSEFTGRKPRMREIDNVLAEVDTLPSSRVGGRKVVGFLDDNIAAKPSRAKKLFKALIPKKILWGSQACITFGNDEELVGLAAESGCRFLLVGLESLSPNTLKEIGKGQNKAEQYEEALRTLRKHGIFVLGSFVFGFDSEEESAFADTLQFAVRNKLSLAQFSILTPYPGTRLYSQLLSENRLEQEYWLDPSWETRMVFEPNGRSAKKISENVSQVQRDFYSFRSIINRIHYHPLWRIWITANLVYRRAVRNKWSPLS